MEKVHIGTMGWSYSFWVGNFYPKGTKQADFLTEYSKHFDTVEVDNTFYRIPSRDVLENWKRQTQEGFLFSSKFPQVITHKKMLKDCEQELQFFIERVSTFETKLGPLLLQLPPMFGLEKITVLKEFLRMLPEKYRYVVEVRNRKIFGSSLYKLLREYGVSLALVDSALMPESSEVTADFVYIRWEGDRRKVNGLLGKVEFDRTSDIRVWSDKIQKLQKEAEEVFGYFSKYYSGHPPTDAEQLNRLLT